MARRCTPYNKCGKRTDWWLDYLYGNGGNVPLPESHLVIDSFTGSNGTSIASRNSDSGDTWTVRTGALTFENNALHNPNNTIGVATVDNGWTNLSASFDGTMLQSGEEMGIVFRYVDVNNYWRAVVIFQGPGFRIVKRESGVDTIVASSVNYGNGHVRIEVSGNKVVAYIPSIGAIVAYTGINSLGSSSTIHGIYMRKNATDANNPTRGNLDNFMMWEKPDVTDIYLSNRPVSSLMPIQIYTPTTQTVIQRNGSTADIIISGRIFFDDNDHEIEASFNGGAYQTIATTKQLFTGILLNQSQGQGNLIVRIKDTPSKSITIPVIGIGDVFICAGQSNMSGLGLNNQTWTHATLIATNYGNSYAMMRLADPYDTVVNQIDTVSIGSPTPLGSYIPKLAELFMADQNVPVMFVPCAAGGTDIASWQKGATADDRTTLFGSMIHRFNQLQNGAKAVLMHQGESNATLASGPTNPATYEALMNTFVNDTFDNTGIPVVLCKIHKWDGSPTTDQTSVDNLNARIQAVIDSNVNALQGADFDKPTRVSASLHFSLNSELTDAGTRLWNALQAIFYP